RKPAPKAATGEPAAPASATRPGVAALTPTSESASPPAAAGQFDLASVRRAWPAVVAEFKKLKPSRSHLFDSTELEISGDTLVVEFPKNQAFAIDLASNPDTHQILRRSIGAVLGMQPPVQFRLGRQGSSEPVAAPVAAEAPDPVDVPPATAELDESPATAHPVDTHVVPGRADAAQTPTDDLESRLINELGAFVVDERTNESDS
ncbi:MAG: hypothetical protein WBI63_02430, partial [Coriobacteriia bacterium]